jgi:hypothetical protein
VALVTGFIDTVAVDWQCPLSSPAIVPGVATLFLDTVLHLGVDVPQALVAVTQMGPLLKLEAKAMVTLFVPCPAVTVAFAGGVQV